MQSSRPLLVIVSGAPGSGKTTLACRLARDLPATLISKDVLKEALADALGPPASVEESSRLGVAAYAAMHALAAAIVGDAGNVVLESNFRRGQSEAELAAALGAADVRLMHCRVSPATVERRYRERRGRHRAHLDALRGDDVMRDLSAGLYEPLSLDCPRLVVATEDEYDPPYEAVLAFALARSGAAK